MRTTGLWPARSSTLAAPAPDFFERKVHAGRFARRLAAREQKKKRGGWRLEIEPIAYTINPITVADSGGCRRAGKGQNQFRLVLPDPSASPRIHK
jgi:hypothetical protein